MRRKGCGFSPLVCSLALVPLAARAQSPEKRRRSRSGARLASLSIIDGVNTTVARLRTELRDAKYEFDQTVVRAPQIGGGEL